MKVALENRITALEGGAGNDDVGTYVAATVQVDQRFPVDGRNRLPRPQDAVPVGVAAPEPLAMELEDQIVRCVLHRRDLLEDDLLLPLQIPLLEDGIANQVRQYVDGLGDVCIQNPSLVAGVLPTRIRIQGATQTFEGQGDLAGRATPFFLDTRRDRR